MVFLCEVFFGSLWIPIALSNMLSKKNGIQKKWVCLVLCFLVCLCNYLYVNEILIVVDILLLGFILYIFSNRSWQKVIYVPISYILIVICNYFAELLFLQISSLSIEQMAEKMPYALYLDCVITLLVFWGSFLIGRVIQYVKKTVGRKVRKEMFWLIGGNIILCTIVFLLNGWNARRAGFPNSLYQTNLILFGAYAILAIVISFIVLKVFREREEMEHEKQQYESLQEYTKQIETMYTNLRTFKHDYVNILTSLSGYLDAKDYEGLETYFIENILPTNQTINRENYRLNQLSNIKDQALKGLISSKLIYAHEMGIDVFIDIMEPIETIHMKAIDLSRIMGIYLDNAIEAAMECEKKEIKFNMVKEEHTVAIILMNSFENKGMPFSKMEQCGYSSKGENRGLGLHNVKEILQKYENVCKTTAVQGEYFVQKMEISE